MLLFIGCKSYNNQLTKASRVSLISVIANPEKYHGETIIVEGYFVLESEGDAVFISKNDYTSRMYKNGIYLFLNLKELKLEKPYNGYVRLTGKFNKNIKGSYDFYSGLITVDSIQRLQRFDSKGNSTDIME